MTFDVPPSPRSTRAQTPTRVPPAPSPVAPTNPSFPHAYPPGLVAALQEADPYVHTAQASSSSSLSPPLYDPYLGSPKRLGDKTGILVGAGPEVVVDVRAVLPVRTPSPTPSEARILDNKTHTVNWRALRDWRRFMNRRDLLTIAGVAVAIGFIAAFLAHQHKIIHWMEPFSDWMYNTPGGWLIPIAIMFVISFPPLFGHELIVVLCGVVWGVWIGFGIAAAGTVLGELANFYAFKWFCAARGRKFEEKHIKYALYAQVIREGGIFVPTIMRLTFIPGHLTTAVFSTCGMGVWAYLASAILSLPKQLAAVYIGVSKDTGNNPAQTAGIKAVVVLATLAMTMFSMRYINKKVDEVKGGVIYRRRKARQARAFQDGSALSLAELEREGAGPAAAAPIEMRMPQPQRAASLAGETHHPQPSSTWSAAEHALVPNRRESERNDGAVAAASGDVELAEPEHGALRPRRHAEGA